MNKFDVKLAPDFTGFGTCGHFTWNRLAKILQTAGELQDDESVDGFTVTEDGVNFYVKKLDNT